MAINRKIITWDTVFESKRYDQILNMLIENYKAIYGGDINLSVNTAEGETLRMMATYLYDFSSMANEVYQSLDINNAKNTLLDNLVLLSGNLVRKDTRSTKLTATISWVGDDVESYVFPSTQFILLDGNFNQWIISPIDTNLTVLDSDGVNVNIESVLNGDIYLANSFIDLTVDGGFLTNDIIITNIITIEQGSIKETDRQLRQRRKEALSYNSRNLVDSIRQEVLANIFAITDIKIYNSNIVGGKEIVLHNGIGNTTFTIPEHDIFVLIKPQTIPVGDSIVPDSKTSLALADILQRKITLGISTFQDDIIKVQAVTTITLGVNYIIETLGTTDWNTVFGTTGITYEVSDDGIATVIGTGTGIVSSVDANYITQVVSANEAFPSITETFKYYIARPFRAHIIINLTSVLNSGYNQILTLARIRQALYDLSRDYPINKPISIAEIVNEVNTKGNINANNPSFLISSVAVTEGTDVKNGYWYVDGNDDSFITLA
jgi:hypothetical protein